MAEYQPLFGANGELLQSAVPKVTEPTVRRGLLLRAVVTQTYVFDAPEPPVAVLQDTGTSFDPTPVDVTHPAKKAIYCDVWCYGTRYTGHLPRALVLQERGGLHEGRIWIPRPARFDVTADGMDLNLATNPANVDGDHVLVGFIDDNPNQPVILGGIQHPSSDIGNSTRIAGHRMRLGVDDGAPDFRKHRGVFHGVDDEGNYVIDLRRAHIGEYESDGSEPEPALDGSSGNVEIRIPRTSTLTIKIEDGPTLRLEGKEDEAKLTVGDGAMHVAIVEHLKALYEELKAKLDVFDSHTHIYAFGPTLDPIPKIQAPAWDSAIESSKVSFPDG